MQRMFSLRLHCRLQHWQCQSGTHPCTHTANVIVGAQSDRFRPAAEALFAAWGVEAAVVQCDVGCDASVARAMQEVGAMSGGHLHAVMHSVAFAPASAMKRCVGGMHAHRARRGVVAVLVGRAHTPCGAPTAGAGASCAGAVALHACRD